MDSVAVFAWDQVVKQYKIEWKYYLAASVVIWHVMNLKLIRFGFTNSMHYVFKRLRLSQ